MKRIGALLVLLWMTSCEKTIDPRLKDQSPKLVVEAEIENGQPPLVILTRSVGFFSTINPSLLADMFVRDAVVTISDGTTTHQLKEFAVPVAQGFVYYYSNDPAQPATAITGAFGKQYTLSIQTGGRSYTATTAIPQLNKTVDSLWWLPAPRPETGKEIILWARVTDPPGFGDYIRYFTKRNSEPFFPGFYSAYDDQFVDGKTYDIQVDPGQNLNLPPADRFQFFQRGDTITLKFANITKASFDFWRTWEYSFAAIGNPFAAPTVIQANISNGALGHFTGYAVQYKTIIVPQ